MRVALDTNRYRDLADGVGEVVELLEQADAIHVPFVVVGELRAGFAVGQKGPLNERMLHRLLAKPGVHLLYADDATTRSYAELYRQLRTQGTPIPTNDLWIAALAIQHRLVLATRDQHFQHLPQLTCV